MERIFQNAKNKLGFGIMRPPMNGEEIDTEELKKMIDVYMEAGFNYFDTAHSYCSGKSELAIKECITSRYPRESYVLTDKLTDCFFNSNEDIRPLIDTQLECCGVEYFDILLMHAQGRKSFAHFKKNNAYETVMELKKEGKIRHFGISFHDTAEVLEEILTEYPQIETVQIQLNYLDYDDENVQGRKLIDVCKKHNKPIIVMEPVKGGRLANLPAVAKKEIDALNGGSPASYALRFATGCENVEMVLSGMSTMEQVKDNISFMKDFKPLDEMETKAVDKVCAILKNENLISCTSCRYCVEGCPKNILIPDIFTCMNTIKLFGDESQKEIYMSMDVKASECIKCGKCEDACPQHLEIRNLLEKVSEELSV